LRHQLRQVISLSPRVLIFIINRNYSGNAISEKARFFAAVYSGNSCIEKLMSLLLKAMTFMWFVCLAACETWIRQEGIASLGATLYTSRSLSECLSLCLEMSSCVAVDFSVVVCGVHTNINNTATTFSAPGFTQYTLNRACQTTPALTSTSSTSSTDGTETSTLTTYFGE